MNLEHFHYDLYMIFVAYLIELVSAYSTWIAAEILPEMVE